MLYEVITRLTAASTLSHEDAVYLDNWRRRIESIGNLNYPEQARRDKIYGALRVITSYSIHYTKLYECRTARSVPPPAVDPAGRAHG